MLTEYATSKIKNKEMIEPTLFIIDSLNKEMGMISGGDLPYDGNIKQKIFENIGEDYAQRMPNADMFVMMTEAWASTSSEKTPNMMPHEDPNRIEVYMVSAKRANGDEKNFTQAFKRDDDGNAEFLDREEMPSLNHDWAKTGAKNKDGVVSENRLLTALWRKFMMSKIINQINVKDNNPKPGEKR